MAFRHHHLAPCFVPATHAWVVSLPRLYTSCDRAVDVAKRLPCEVWQSLGALAVDP
jgi:hypothetical protein